MGIDRFPKDDENPELLATMLGILAEFGLENERDAALIHITDSPIVAQRPDYAFGWDGTYNGVTRPLNSPMVTWLVDRGATCDSPSYNRVSPRQR